MERARYLRAIGDEAGSWSLLAQPHQFTSRPTDIDKWFEMLLLSAEDLQRWRLRLPDAAPLSHQGQDYYPLKALAGADYQLNEALNLLKGLNILKQ